MTAPSGGYPAERYPGDRAQRVATAELASLRPLREYAWTELHHATAVARRVRLVPYKYRYVGFVLEHGVWGFAGRRLSGRGHAEVGYAPGCDKSLLALALAHELGHCEQFLWTDVGGRDRPLEYAWHLEADAWHRGLRILGEVDIPVTRPMADYAAHCLGTYMADEVRTTAESDYIWTVLASV